MIVVVLWGVGKSMMLLERIPDQMIVQDADFSLDVEGYFSEPVLEFRVLSPGFLTFTSRKLASREVARLPFDGSSPWDFRAAAGFTSSDVYVLMRESGLLVYDLQPGVRPQLVQHYFEDQVCGNFSSISPSDSVVALYNSSSVTLIDVSDRLFPELMAQACFDFDVRKILMRPDQFVLVSEAAGLLQFDYDAEGGIQLNKSLSEAFGTDFHPTDAIEFRSSLFTLDSSSGLQSVSLPGFDNLRKYGLRGTQMALSNESIVVDGRGVLSLKNYSTWVVDPPMNPDMFTAVKDVYFFGNSSHLVAWNPLLNLSATEELTDLVDLAVINDTLLMVRSHEAVLRIFSPESAVLHGHSPKETGGFEVRFIARGKTNSVEAHFMLMVEAPPFEVLLYLLGGSSAILLLVGLGCFLFKLAAERKQGPIPGMHIMSEEFTSATHLPRPRELGPMPET